MRTKDLDGSRINVLDGWRAISVALVIVSHVLSLSAVGLVDGRTFESREIYAPLIDGLGRLGVSVFFVISGFVITRGLAQEMAEIGRVSLTAFYVRRFFRIVPALALYLLVILVLAVFGFVDLRVGPALRVLTFTCNIPFANCGGRLTGHTCSLSVEEQFYLVIPLLFVLAASFRRWVLSALGFALAGSVIGLAALQFPLTAVFLVHFMTIGAGVTWALNEDRGRRVVTLLPGWIVYPMLALLPQLARGTMTTSWPAVSAILAIILVFLLMATMLKPTYLQDFLLLPAIRKVGRVSYGIYLWQQLATYAFGSLALNAFLLMSSVVWAFMSFRWIEKPLIALGAGISRKLIAKRM